MNHPSTFRLGTFNVENLVARYRFKQHNGIASPAPSSNPTTVMDTVSAATPSTSTTTSTTTTTSGVVAAAATSSTVNPSQFSTFLSANYTNSADDALSEGEEEGFLRNRLLFRINDEEQKILTSRAILELDADILCLQEVESLSVLDRFNKKHLQSRYRYRMLVEGNDVRGIHVGILSRFPLGYFRSFRSELNRDQSAPLFARDCLEVEVWIPIPDSNRHKTLVLFINHFSSMAFNGRSKSRDRRMQQANRVAELVDERFYPAFDGNFAVVGDLNDYDDTETSLSSLLQHPQLVNVVKRLPEEDRWTRYYPEGDEYRQLDYILLGKRLDSASSNPTPFLLRKGIPGRAVRYTGTRYNGVGFDRPKSSDHTPLAIDIPYAALS